LAQEAAYESILPRKRKELHRKVAGSIEKVFGERLHEFYGMLAYHYSRAENLDKAEEYLIRAGEESLSSSASNEALHYYREALDLYVKKYGDAADPEKVAMLDKNIALALFNRGQYVEAVEYFDRALNYYWGKLSKHAISTIFEFSSAFLHLIISLYLPSLRFKRMPTERDIEIIDLFKKKCKALGIIDPKRFFVESLHVCKEVINYDLTKFKLGMEIFVGASSLFSTPGISFRLSRKLLDFAKERVNKDDARIFIMYELCDTFHNYLEGNWEAIKNYDEDLVDKNLSIGEVYDATQHLYWHGLSNIYQGALDIAALMVTKLNDIIEVYENDFSLLLKYELNANLLIECRKFPRALMEVENTIDFAQKAGLTLFLFDLYSFKARINVLMGDMELTEKCLQQANEARLQVHAIPLMLSTFHVCQFHYFLKRLEESITISSKSESSQYRKKAIKSCKMLLKVSKKAAQHRTETYKLVGVYYWLINEPENAVKWWHKAIEEGERLGARLELSRTYFEVGKRLLEPENKCKRLNGIEAEEYLEKARVLFVEMDLQWDLDELSRVARG
ncbi:MAG: tetratricopeptide repeat protein, partial [Desulfobacteraceae bacterium]